jgi:hypothetical protein
MAKKNRNSPGQHTASAIPLEDETPLADHDPVQGITDGVRSAHGGAMRRRRVDDDHVVVELDRFIDPSELWP